MNSLVQGFESVTIGLVHCAYPVHLGVVGSHNRAVVANERLGCFAVILEGFVVDLAVTLDAHCGELAISLKSGTWLPKAALVL